MKIYIVMRRPQQYVQAFTNRELAERKLREVKEQAAWFLKKLGALFRDVEKDLESKFYIQEEDIL